LGQVGDRPRGPDSICRAGGRNGGCHGILLLIAVICFVLAAIGLDVKVSLVAVGLAFFAASFLVTNRGIRP
jgi:hypothetical protein